MSVTRSFASRGEGPPPHYSQAAFLALRSSLRAFCLGVTGFTNPPIGQALVASIAQQVGRAFCIANTERSAAVVAEIEFCEMAAQVSLTATLVAPAPHNPALPSPKIPLICPPIMDHALQTG